MARAMASSPGPSAPPQVRRAAPLLALLFAGSGCAALVYQVIWLQMLQLAIGSTAASLGVLLSTFMGGMALGSALLPRLVDTRRHPLMVYAAIEALIAACGLAIFYAMPLVNRVYAVSGGALGTRAALAAACLLAPTLLMGATLPAIARWVEPSASGIAWLGLFYGANIAGAVAGTLLAGFYLLRVYDMAVASHAAVALNVVLAVASLTLARRLPWLAVVDATPLPAAARQTDRSGRSRGVAAAIALSGFTALACEVVWTRLLSLSIGATVYAFSSILAAFLVGLGIGSSAGAALARRTPRPAVLLAGCQALLAVAIAWAAWLIADYLPYRPAMPARDPWTSLRMDLWRCLLVVLPGSMLWGASFPLALAAASARGADTGRLAGATYAWNTAGAITGSLAAVAMTATLGSQRTQQLLALTCAGAALAAITAAAPRPRSRAAWSIASIVVVAFLASWSIPPLPRELIAYGRNAASWMHATTIDYAGEGLNAFVAVTRSPSGAPIYHAAGKVQASSEGEDMRLQRTLAHFSHLLPRRPANVLVVGLGAGITAGAISIAPGVERMTIAEIEPLVPAVADTYFADYNFSVVRNPRVTIRLDDARHVLLTSDQRYDVITSDLVDPWVKGTAALFTREFFESAKAHLAPGGVVTMFVQLYLSNLESVKSEIGTFVEVFPNTIVWGNTSEGRGYDLVLTGQVEPFAIDVDRLQATLDEPRHAAVAQSLREIGVSSAVDLLSTYAGTAADLRPWLAGAALNTDRNLRLQYLAGLALDLQQSGPIYDDLLRYRRFPGGVFAGSPQSLALLRAAIERADRSGRERVARR